MLPESIILKNHYHNQCIVNLILEQSPLKGWATTQSGATSQASLIDQYQIPGLTGRAPRWVPNELRTHLEKQGKKLPPGIRTYPSYESYIADVIYQSKGITDNENNIARAIMAIKSASQFDKVLKELKKLTNGRGIGQFIYDVFGTYTTDKSGKITGWAGMDHWKRAKRLERIIDHLNSINANSESINMIRKALGNIQQVAKQEKSRWESDEFAAAKWATENKHEIAFALSIAAMFLPVAGMAISSGIMAADAAMYYDEGRYMESGTMAIFALLPIIGGAFSKLPAVQKLTAKGMAQLGKRLATSKSPILNRLEQIVIKDMSKYAPQIKQDMNAYFQRRIQNNLTKILKSTKGPKARRLMYRLGTGTLKASVFGAKLGIGFIPYELSLNAWEKIYSKFDIQSKEDVAREAKNIEALLRKAKGQ